MKILELCLSPNFGGLEIFVCRTTEMLSKDNDTVAVTLPQSPVRTRLLENGCHVLTLRSQNKRLPLLAANKLAKIIDELNIDLVHVNWGPDLTIAALAKLFSKKKPKLVHTRHMSINRRKQDYYHNFVYGQFDLILAITDEMKQALKKYLPAKCRDRIHHLYCGVPAAKTCLTSNERKQTREKLRLPEKGFVAGVFSRLEAAKGQHLMIEAVSCLREQGTAIYGLIVGHSMDDDYKKELQQLVRQQGLEKQIVFFGFSEQPQTLMQACDCVILPTDRETFGLVLIEAMRCGVATIGTNAGGVPEIIKDNHNGLLFEPGNHVHLAEKIRSLHDNQDYKKALAIAGHDRAQRKFSSERQTSKLLKFFEDLVAEQQNERGLN